MRVNVAKAREDLEDLIAAEKAGEEVVIVQDGVPAVMLSPVQASRFEFGVLKDVLTGPGPDFFEPMIEEDLRAWEGKT